MSIRRALQIVTFAFALAFAMSVPAASSSAYVCDPTATGGLC